MRKLSIIVPSYNEEEVLAHSAAILLAKFSALIEEGKIAEESSIVFVDDGSKDKTWEIINDLAKKSSYIKGIKLSRNYGHQNALLAGLFTIESDFFISIDADLQDDVNAIDEMIEKYLQGFEVVYGVRNNRDNDTYFKRATAGLFYKLMQTLGVDIIDNHADFRLMSARAVDALKSFTEINLFLRGIVPLIGYKSIKVYYVRKNRDAGESKYPLKKMLSFAWQGVTSFSVVPLRIISVIGFTVFIASILLGFWILYIKFFTVSAIPGWASSMLIMNFIGGLQLLSLGVIGEYIGKIYQEVKQRPRYFVDQII